MENPNVSELLLLLEVTRIEDLARSSNQNNQRDAGRLRRVEAVAEGFRNLVTDPERYDVEDKDLQNWATILKTELDGVEESSSSRDLAVKQLSEDLVNGTSFRNDLDQALKDAQKQALFPSAGA